MSCRRSMEPADAGTSLVEVLVALLVFGVIASGMAAGAMSITRIAADSRSRHIAVNLAAQNLDAARANGDPETVEDGSSTWSDPSNGRVFSVTRTSSWVDVDGADAVCGTNAVTRYRRITAAVTWGGRLPTTPVVSTSTVIASNGQGVDLSTGSISVRVTGAGGDPRAGVGVAIAVNPGSAEGRTPGLQPRSTDSSGCSYIDGLQPGVYDVTLQSSGSIDVQQVKTPIRTISVAAGSVNGVAVQYDRWATYSVAYGGSYASSAVLPTNLTATLDPGSASSVVRITAAQDASVALHPFSQGYSTVAGAYTNSGGAVVCRSMDPRAWPAQTIGSTSVSAGVRGSAYAAPGGTAALPVSMGILQVADQSGKYLTAVPVPPAGDSGDPGCATPPSSSVFPAATTNSVRLALPFGTWRIYSGSTSGATTTVVAARNLVPLTNVVNSAVIDDTVTMDPRARAQ